MEQISARVTSYAISVNATLPNLTIPHFEVEAGYVNGLGGMIACAYAPFVLDGEREQWEEYAFSNRGWVNESIMLRQIHTGHLAPLTGTKDDENTHETAFQGPHGALKEKRDQVQKYDVNKDNGEDEYLIYAKKNRDEWEEREEVVREMVEQVASNPEP